jgi:DNA-binding transcriptional regulator YiaG
LYICISGESDIKNLKNKPCGWNLSLPEAGQVYFMEYKEIWIDVSGFEGLYQISNLGRVKSLDRQKNYNGGLSISKGRFLSFDKSSDYCRVTLVDKNSNKKRFLVHRLVCENFLFNKKQKRTVNHIDGNKKNNFLNNLEWMSYSENHKHAYKNGLKNKKGVKHHLSKFSENDIKFIRSKTKLSIRQLSELFNVHIETIRSIKNNKTWTHI